MNHETLPAQGPVDVDVSHLTLDKLRTAAAMMRKNAVPPCVVKTAKEARAMTKADLHLTGHKWKVGEEYYHADTLR